MHICLLTSGRIFESIYGGEERFTISIGEWLTKGNHDVVLLASQFASVKAMTFPEFARNNIGGGNARQEKMRALNPPYLIYVISRMAMSLLWIMKIISINLKCPITIIHAQDTGYGGLAAVISGKFLRIPVLLSSHGIRHKTLESIITGKFRRLFLKLEYNLDLFTIKHADSVIAVNQPIKEYLQEITSRQINFVPIGIKFAKYQYSKLDRDLIRKEFGLNEDDKVVGFVGRFSMEKNLFTLLKSFANAIESVPALKLVLVGTGALEDQFREFLKLRMIGDKVIFCGVRNDIPKILSSFDIFVLPSYAEGMSTALLEAMACGRAIICSDIPANRALITPYENGLLVNPDQVGEIKDAIELLANNYSLQIRMGQNARIKAEEYDEENVFPKIMYEYEKILRKKS